MERVCNFVIVVRHIIEYFTIILKLNLPVQNMSNYKKRKKDGCLACEETEVKKIT